MLATTLVQACIGLAASGPAYVVAATGGSTNPAATGVNVGAPARITVEDAKRPRHLRLVR